MHLKVLWVRTGVSKERSTSIFTAETTVNLMKDLGSRPSLENVLFDVLFESSTHHVLFVLSTQQYTAC
jgi:hypothetical protein